MAVKHHQQPVSSVLLEVMHSAGAVAKPEGDGGFSGQVAHGTFHPPLQVSYPPGAAASAPGGSGVWIGRHRGHDPPYGVGEQDPLARHRIFRVKDPLHGPVAPVGQYVAAPDPSRQSAGRRRRQERPSSSTKRFVTAPSATSPPRSGRSPRRILRFSPCTELEYSHRHEGERCMSLTWLILNMLVDFRNPDFPPGLSAVNPP